jgi:hypothetical protein
VATNLNKKILITAELVSSPVGEFFKELGFEFSDTFENGETYAFAVDNACPDVLTVPRLQISQSLYPKLAPTIRGHISPEFFQFSQGKKLLQSHFNEAEELDLVDRYSKDLKTVYTVKLHDYLNIGFFADSIVIEAYKANFDIAMLRNYLNTALNFSFKKIEKNTEGNTPIDISYSHDEEAFAIQLSFQVDTFEGKEELKNIFDTLSANSNYFDVTYFERKGRLTISSLIFKDMKMKKSSSYFFTEVIKRSPVMEIEEVKTNLYSGLFTKEDVPYSGPNMETDEVRQLSIARKFALFIKNCRKKEENPRRLEIDDIDAYLSFYPKKKSLEEITPVVKELMYKILKDDEMYLGISEYIQKISGSNLNDQVKGIQDVLKMKSLSDIEEMVALKTENQEGQVSPDGTPIENDGNFHFKAWLEKEEEIQRVAGNVGLSTNEVWEMKRNQLSAVIQDEFTRIFSEGRNIVQDDIVRVVAQGLNANKNEIQPIVEWIVEEAIASEMVKNKQIEVAPAPVDNKKLEEDFAAKLLEEPAPPPVDLLREKLESQNLRMKKLMEQMKNELLRMKSEQEEARAKAPLTTLDEEEKNRLSKAIERAMSALKSKDRFIEKLKQDHENISTSKDIQLNALEMRIEEMKAEYARSREFANEEKLEMLSAENKTLLARLNLANKKVNIINENVENSKDEIEEKYEKEIDALKLSVQMAQTLIERLKQDKHDMEVRFLEERETFKSNSDSEGGGKKEGQVQSLTTEKKALEEKLRAQSIELKKVEQKLKYANSQLDSSSGKKAAAANVKTNEAYAKQLDLMNMRMENANAEVVEKRKELVKLKQENNLLLSRLSELEKRLAGHDKKAS